MKYIKINFILCFVMLSFWKVNAQNTQTDQVIQPLDTVQPKVNSEMVHVAFGETKKEDLITGVSYLNVDDLMQVNNMNASGVDLRALVPGYSGGNNIWGSGMLVLVDGIPRDLGNIMPSEIEQITVLKGVGAVALYGSMAAKGIILVTTKRGVNDSESFRAWVDRGIFVPITYPKYLGSAEYMSLYNEAQVNDGITPSYIPEDIYNTASGSNPYRYPDVDYYSSDYLKKFTSRTNVATEFRGGGEFAQFYANMGFYKSNTLLKVGQGDNESVSRFHVRGNVDIKINDFITGKINTSMAFYNTAFGKGDYWSNAATMRPNWYTPLIPISYLENSDQESQELVNNSPFLIDGKYLLGGTQQQLTTPFAALYTQGLQKYTARQYQFDATLNFDLAFLAEGLSFRTQYAVDYYSRYFLDEDINDYAIYVPTWNNYQGYDQISRIKKWNEDKVKKGRNLRDSYEYQKAFFSGIFDYKKTWNEDHNIAAKLLATVYQRTVSKQYHRDSNANLGMQFQYNYMQKYYVDFTEAVVHSAKFAPGRRTEFSPTLSLGWRLSEESFMGNVNFIDNLKLTASAGLLNTDLDISDYYRYRGIYVRPGGYQGYDVLWNEGYRVQVTNITRGSNLALGFVQRKELNLGLEASLFNNKLELNGAYYRTEMSGGLIQDSNAYPGFYEYGASNFIPYTNNDIDLFTGLDFGITLNQKLGEVDLKLGVVGTYSKSKATKRSENIDYDYLTRVGKPVDGIWGLVSDGFFMNQNEVDNAPSQAALGGVRAGDIKYKDQNDDGKIDTNDIVYLGRYGSPFIGGVNITAKWKNFSLFALFSGSFGGYDMKTNDYFRVNGSDKYSEIVRNRTIIGKDVNDEWEVTKLGSYPALTTTGGDNNFTDSDYWVYKTDRIDLSQVQLTFKVPTKLLEKVFVKDLDIFINGANLLTFAKEKDILNTYIGSEPKSRFFNLGFKANF
ncbi:SusC/RagA family TonB-linked outer membrane protein [Confluentibacter sediminis]|uniref:SusC/RagA family TonB-linked outer membrane protein n=1 Tax=Confluentibacter sediminis TaxID=2219045 RepID=UPI0013A6A485|nr:SusC/RagA family TonB-linked outer membrane protein [Confluentibacter sediminis]